MNVTVDDLAAQLRKLRYGQYAVRGQDLARQRPVFREKTLDMVRQVAGMLRVPDESPSGRCAVNEAAHRHAESREHLAQAPQGGRRKVGLPDHMAGQIGQQHDRIGPAIEGKHRQSLSVPVADEARHRQGDIAAGDVFQQQCLAGDDGIALVGIAQLEDIGAPAFDGEAMVLIPLALERLPRCRLGRSDQAESSATLPAADVADAGS